MQQRHRLRDSRDFERIRREGRTLRTSSVILNVCLNGLGYNRYGFVTSRQLGKAVQRNRIRRVLREAVRGLHPRIQAGCDVVLVARPELAGKPLAAVQRILEQLLSHAGLIAEGAPE